MVKALWHTACNKNMALHPFPALYNANPQNKEGWQWRSQISVITGALGGGGGGGGGGHVLSQGEL